MCGLFAKINDTNRDKDRGGYGLARIAGVDLPRKKRIEIGMTYIYGIGQTTATRIVNEAEVDPDTRVVDLDEGQVIKLRDVIVKNHMVEGDLRREISFNIKTKMN